MGTAGEELAEDQQLVKAARWHRWPLSLTLSPPRRSDERSLQRPGATHPLHHHERMRMRNQHKSGIWRLLDVMAGWVAPLVCAADRSVTVSHLYLYNPDHGSFSFSMYQFVVCVFHFL